VFVLVSQSQSSANKTLLVPALQRLVYSTCSVHAIENEQVVLRALKSEEARAGNLELAGREQVIPTWHRRGTRVEGMDEPMG
jgi:putative methyltransferase